MVVAPELLSDLNAEQLRELAHDLIAQISNRDQQIAGLDQTISSKDREILYRQAKIDQLTHEMAVLKRWKFGRSREQLDASQVSLELTRFHGHRWTLGFRPRLFRALR